MIELVKGWVQNFMSLSLGLKLGISTLLGALGSSTVIGYLAELGAVNYALAYGARLPTEGVPFLRYAATGISLALFVFAFGSFFVVGQLIKFSLHYLVADPKLLKLSRDGALQNIPLTKYLLFGIPPAVGSTQLLTWLLLPLVPQIIGIVIAFCFAALILLLGRKPQLTKWVILSSFALATLGFFVAAFTPSLYGKALHFTRHGGGIEVRLLMNCSGRTPCENQIAGNLFLKTVDAYLLRDPKTQEFREIVGRNVDGVYYVGEERWGTK